MNIYLAAPIVNIPEDWKDKIQEVKNQLNKIDDCNVYDPREHGVPNAWGMSMSEWSHCIFTMDVLALDDADWVVVCDFGRDCTAGTAWEAGYAFGKGKKVLIVRMCDNSQHYSVMMNGCCANYVSYSSLMLIEKGSLFKTYFVERGRAVGTNDVMFD